MKRPLNRSGDNRGRRSKWTIALRLALLIAIVASLFFFLKHTIDSGNFPFIQQKNNGLGLNGQPNPSASSIPFKPHTVTSPTPTGSQPITTPTPLVNIPGLLHVQGNQIIGPSGQPV